MSALEPAGRRVGHLFLLVFLLLGAGIIAAGTLYYQKQKQQIRAEAGLQLSAIADLKVDELMHWRQERLGDANTVFNNPSFVGLVRRFFAKPSDIDAQRQILVWIAKIRTSYQYNRVFLVDARGNERLAAPDTPEPVASHLPGDVIEVLRSERITFLDLHRDAPGGPIYLGILIPILDESVANRPLGVLVLRMDPTTYLYPLLSRWPTPSPTVETLLVRRDGHEVLFLNELRFQTHTALNLRISLEKANTPAVMAALGQEGIVEGRDYRDVPVLAALRTIPDSPWSLVARIDIAEVYAPLQERMWLTVLLVAVLLLGAGTGVELVWRQQRLQFYRDRLKGTEALRASEERFRIAAEASNDGVYEWDLIQSVQWFGKIDEMLGYPHGEFPRTLDGWAAAVHPEDLERTMAAVQAHLKESALYDAEYRVRRKDGVYRWWAARGAAARTPDGKPIRWIGTVTDITERKRIEGELRASEERFRRAVADSPFPMLLHAEDGAIIHASNSWCEITGYMREELATIADWTERAFGERKERIQADIEALYGLDRPKAEGDYRIQTKDGASRIWDFSSAPLGRLPDGRRLVLSMAMDVTERREAENDVRWLNAELEQRVKIRTRQLEAANQELEAFSYSVSHDLRAPLRAIDGFARILTEEHTQHLDAEGRRVLDVICAEARRMGQLIDDLLRFSRISRQPMRMEDVDMGALTQTVFDECAAQAPGRKLQFKLQTMPPAYGDPALLRQVLANLIANAIKYTRPKDVAEIELGGHTEGEENLYYVKDNGVGFEIKYVDKLFGVFQRLHSEAEFEGTGVGLALVQRVINRQGGRVWAEGKVNEGATFYFMLPKRKE